LCAIRLRDRPHLALGFTVGALLGVVAFDLLPEIFTLSSSAGGDARAAMLALAGGFLVFHGLQMLAQSHTPHNGDHACAQQRVGLLSAAMMASHSFVDGVGIGVAFQISSTTGFMVAMAVIAHDFCDGLNTVSVMLLHRNTEIHARRM